MYAHVGCIDICLAPSYIGLRQNEKENASRFSHTI